MVLRNSSIAFLFLMLGLPGFAQSSAATQANSPEAWAEVRRAHRRYGVTCWKQAGMTADMVNQRWYIEDRQKVEIAQVCAEPTTSAQQKHDKIEQIHADTDSALAQLIPAKALSAFNKCEAELNQSRPKPANQKELGPCGGVIPNSMADTKTAAEHQHMTMPTNQ